MDMRGFTVSVTRIYAIVKCFELSYFRIRMCISSMDIMFNNVYRPKRNSSRYMCIAHIVCHADYNCDFPMKYFTKKMFNTTAQLFKPSSCTSCVRVRMFGITATPMSTLQTGVELRTERGWPFAVVVIGRVGCVGRQESARTAATHLVHICRPTASLHSAVPHCTRRCSRHPASSQRHSGPPTHADGTPPARFAAQVRVCVRVCQAHRIICSSSPLSRVARVSRVCVTSASRLPTLNCTAITNTHNTLYTDRRHTAHTSVALSLCTKISLRLCETRVNVAGNNYGL